MRKILPTLLLTLTCTTLLALMPSPVQEKVGNNWIDHGLTEESVKYLTEKEKQDILNSKTPAQTQEYFEKGIQDGSIKPEDVPVPFLNLSNTASTKPDTPLSDEVVSCFDYYTFGSIEAPIQSRSSRTVSGTQITFFGDIINKNSYPVVEGTLYVKIMKNIGSVKNPNGPDVVDQFIAVDNVTLPANGSIPFEFTWKIPAYATTGDYRVVTYFTSDKKFNLQGLSFTDDIVGNSFDFTVKGEQQEIIAFDKSSVVINDNPYYFAAYPPRISKGQQVNISLDILNDTPTNQNAQIKWKLYKWDAMNPENLVREFTTNTETKANANKTTVKLEIPEDSEPVYLLVGELQYQDTKSIVNIRYVRDGVDKVRLNYPAVTSYPLKQGEQTTLFTCLHNSGQSPQVRNNTVLLEVKNEKGKVIESYTYEGAVTGEMMAVKKDFTTKTNLGTFSVHASLYTDGKLVDESTMEYNCKDLDPTLCSGEAPRPTLTPSSFSMTQIIIVIAVILLLVIILVLLKKRKKDIRVVFVLFVLAGSLFISDVAVPQSSAQVIKYNHDVRNGTILPDNLINPNIINGSRQALWSQTIISNLTNHWQDGLASGWSTAIKNFNITVKYNAKITNIDTGENLLVSSTVPVGTNLRLQFIPHHPYDIYWFGTGYSDDSPYGEWRTDARPPPEVTCEQKDFTYSIFWSDWNLTNSFYVPLVISPPAKSFSNDDIENLSCGAIQGNETVGYYIDCKVDSEGILNLAFNFGDTNGKFYYRSAWSDLPEYCYGDNVPLHYVKHIYAAWVDPGSVFVLYVPSQTISYTLTAVAPPSQNKSPTISIAGPTAGILSTLYSFSITADDPDTDKVKIEIDWDNDGTGDIFLPSGAEEFVAPPTIQTGSKQWSTLGGKTFKARTIDEHGAMSDWSAHSITLTNVPINGSCGSAHNQTYPSTRTAYAPDVQCAQGNPSSTTFPTIGASVTWTCSGQYEGQSSGPCAASITAPVDMCANIEDIQTTVPTGLASTAGNCTCGG